MSPKLRGGGSRRGGRGFVDTWLDDEQSGKGAGRKPHKKGIKAGLSDPALANATVTEVFPNQCRTRLDADGAEILCTYRRAQLLSSEESLRERTPVAVGDRILVERLNPQSGVVEGVAPRANFLARPAPGRDDPNLIHVIAANVDLLVIVASVEQPDFSPGLVDRYLIAAQAAGIPQLVCITKGDLLEGEPVAEPLWKAYGKIGYDWVLISTRTSAGVEELKAKVSGKTVVFCGHSGVGKTSVFRSLIGRDIGKIGDVNVQTGKGRHTTTSAVLYRDEPSGSNWPSNWIDTPGIREFGLIGITPESLASYFPEFSSLGCTLRGCLHLGEEGCEATSLFRYPSYRRIYESLIAG